MNQLSKMFLTEEELPNFSIKYYEKLEELGIPKEDRDELYKKFLKNHVVVKYSKEWQDKNLEYWMDLILNVPGGYWQVQNAIQQPHVEYEHYMYKQKMSYEKGNVTKYRANIELKKENREAYNIFHTTREDKNVFEIEVEGDITLDTGKHL